MGLIVVIAIEGGLPAIALMNRRKPPHWCAC